MGKIWSWLSSLRAVMVFIAISLQDYCLDFWVESVAGGYSLWRMFWAIRCVLCKTAPFIDRISLEKLLSGRVGPLCWPSIITEMFKWHSSNGLESRRRLRMSVWFRRVLPTSSRSVLRIKRISRAHHSPEARRKMTEAIQSLVLARQCNVAELGLISGKLLLPWFPRI